MLLVMGLLALRHRTREAVAITRWSDEVTRRQSAELAAVEASKLGALGKLTGGVAHDFNNLLGALLGQVEMLLCI
jgi:C4-dicarboxylate-specific signal transduction histidine kinase